MVSRFRPVVKESYVSSPFGPRWGTQHRGTDFGLAGGSHGMPVFAAQAGRVRFSGAASGFGGPDPAGWLVLEHADGSNTVYGHIIREVAHGAWVEAGQRIARVNPVKGPGNGNVDPHLHFEVHPRGWAQGSQIDPIFWLGDAPSPGSEVREDNVTVTIFGVDVSAWQDGLSLTTLHQQEGIEFAIIRTTDGTFKDKCYRSHIEDAESAGMITAAYHYVRNPGEGSSIAAQVQASLEVMGDLRRPVWLDAETPAGLHVDHIRETKRRFEDAGVRVIGVYSYVPFWEHKVAPREPDTHEFGAVWVAAYGMNQPGGVRQTYPGDNHQQWVYPLGNQTPKLWQFSSETRFASWRGGMSGVDVNAFKGSREELHELFYGGNNDSIVREIEGEDENMNKATRWILDQLVGPEWDGEAPKFSGWDQTEGRTFVDFVAGKLRLLPGIAKAVAEIPARLDKLEQRLGDIDHRLKGWK